MADATPTQRIYAVPFEFTVRGTFYTAAESAADAATHAEERISYDSDETLSTSNAFWEEGTPVAQIDISRMAFGHPSTPNISAIPSQIVDILDPLDPETA